MESQRTRYLFIALKWTSDLRKQRKGYYHRNSMEMAVPLRYKEHPTVAFKSIFCVHYILRALLQI